MQRGKYEFPGNATRKNPFFPWRGESLVCFPERYFHAECSNPSPHSLQNARNRPHPTTVAAPRRPRREGRKIILYIHALPPTCFVFFFVGIQVMWEIAQGWSLPPLSMILSSAYLLFFVAFSWQTQHTSRSGGHGPARPEKVEGLLPASIPMTRPKLWLANSQLRKISARSLLCAPSLSLHHHTFPHLFGLYFYLSLSFPLFQIWVWPVSEWAYVERAFQQHSWARPPQGKHNRGGWKKRVIKTLLLPPFFAGKADAFLPFPGRNGEISPRRFLFSCDTDLSAS